jgi:putative tryptophan/tyrosine transport system substrate-binding protein
MKRREFITLLGGAAAAWPLAAQAQERMRRLGALIAYTEDNAEAQRWVAAFRDDPQKLGWVEGRNLRIDYRWGGTDMNVLRRFAKEIVAAKPDLIFSSNSPTTQLLKQETRTIPIVFGNLVDPVGQGFVTSLARPGGNVTGFVNLEPSVAGKYVELLKEIAPRLTRVAIFYNPATAPYHEIYLKPFNAAATSLGVVPIVAPIRDLAELETVMATQAREPNSGLIAMPGAFVSENYRENSRRFIRSPRRRGRAA